MELVGARKQALSALDSIEGGSASEEIRMSKENGDASDTNGASKQEENKDVQNDKANKADKVAGSKGQLVQEEEREKAELAFHLTGNISEQHMEELLCPLKGLSWPSHVITV